MISICVPTYNRYEMTVQCFEQVLHDDRIDEIVVVDDYSEDGSYELLKERFKYDSKVKIFRNKINLDCFLNKRMSIDLENNLNLFNSEKFLLYYHI